MGESGGFPAADKAETVHGMAGAAPPDRRQVKEEKMKKRLVCSPIEKNGSAVRATPQTQTAPVAKPLPPKQQERLW